MKNCAICKAKYDDSVSFCPVDGEVLEKDPTSIVDTVLDGQYQIEAMLGKGGMGAVYRARHILLGDRVAINGGLNLSILDGWWLEGYDGTNGFAIGNGVDTVEVSEIDASDAESLYRVLEQEVIPLYYAKDSAGLPAKWIEMMRRAIQTLGPVYNSNRMVEDYARNIYP